MDVDPNWLLHAALPTAVAATTVVYLGATRAQRVQATLRRHRRQRRKQQQQRRRGSSIDEDGTEVSRRERVCVCVCVFV